MDVPLESIKTLSSNSWFCRESKATYTAGMIMAADARVINEDIAPAASALKVESPAKPPAAIIQHPSPYSR